MTSRNLSANKLLALLPREEYERLLPNLERVHLSRGKSLGEAGELVRHAYFLLNGVVSLLSMTENGETIEAAMVGNEGVVGIPVILRVDVCPYRTIALTPVNAMRISAGALKKELDRGEHLQDLLLRYMHSIFIQVSQSATCNHFHKIEKRLCRWLLAMRDRVKEDNFHLTQEFISDMLGAPRSSVTVAALKLQDAGIIRYQRGHVTILDERGLEAAACECYRTVKKETEEFLVA
jgi:CRP-like cAMP-binding protein